MRIFIFGILFILGFTASAQFEQRKWLIGGNIGLQNEYGQSGIEVGPEIARALGNSSLIGVTGSNYAYQTSDGLVVSEEGQGVILGVYYRKYFDLKNNLFFSIQTMGSLVWDENRSQSGNEYFSRAYGLSLEPGLAFKPTEWLMIQSQIGSLSYFKYFGFDQTHLNANLGDLNFSFWVSF